MLKSNISSLVKLILSCMILFLIGDLLTELLSSVIIYIKRDFFPFSWNDVFGSFFRTGYVGGLILGIGIWIKARLQEKKRKRESND